MKLARSTYYYRSRRSAAEKIALHERMAELSAEFPRYGYRRVTHQLRAEGLHINHKAIARIMRENGLQVRPLRRFVRTTQSDHESPIFPNLAQGFTPTGPNQLWVSDLTYVAIAAGFVYVAVILDAWSRRVVGYAISRRIDTQASAGGVAGSDGRAPTSARLHPSFGPGCAVRIRPIPRGAQGARAARIDGPARQSLRQRKSGKFHENAQVRGSLPNRLPDLRPGDRTPSSFHR